MKPEINYLLSRFFKVEDFSALEMEELGAVLKKHDKEIVTMTVERLVDAFAKTGVIGRITVDPIYEGDDTNVL